MSNDHVHPIFQPLLAEIAPAAPLCEECEERPALPKDEYGNVLCAECRDRLAESAWERQQEEPTFRGNEYADWLAEQQDAARRLK